MRGGITGLTRSVAGADSCMDSYLELLDRQRNRNGVLATSLACNSVADDYERYLRGCNSHLVANPLEGIYAAYLDLNSLYAFSGEYFFQLIFSRCRLFLGLFFPGLRLLSRLGQPSQPARQPASGGLSKDVLARSTTTVLDSAFFAALAAASPGTRRAMDGRSSELAR